MEEWRTDRAAACPHFKFWSIILQLELTLMIYVRAIRKGNFELYIESLTKIVLCFRPYPLLQMGAGSLA